MMIVKSLRPALASITAIAILPVLASSAHALSCASAQFTLDEAYEAADSVIVALITECNEEVSSDPWANGGAGCSFVSLEVLKDSAPPRDYGGVASSSGCGLSVHVGGQYLLFLDSENRPMAPSESLGRDHYLSKQTGEYLRILRDFRNGHVNDLAEPWMYEESRDYCSITQNIKGHQISFSRRMPDALPEPNPEWSQKTIDGETVYRAIVPLVDVENGLPVEDAEIVAFGDVPDYGGDALHLRVSLGDESPASVRRASVSVGDRTWSLNRMETNLLSLGGASGHKITEYWAAGEAAEQILSAMIQPSEIVVSATIVSPVAAAGTRDVPLLDEPTPENPGSTRAYVGQTPPISESTGSPAKPNMQAKSYRGQKEPPEPDLRLESRSTQLSSVTKRFRACRNRSDNG